jgi:uncharacterized protein (DUF1499 family)
MMILFVLLIAAVVGFFALRIWARTAPPPELGTQGGVLRPCPESPNCVRTRNADDEHRMDPLPLSVLGGADGAPEQAAQAALDRIAGIVAAMPRGTVTERRDPYLAAEFRSRIMGFIDDVEFLVDEADGVVHFRSASRLGQSDMGANRQRMTEIRRRWMDTD